MNIKRILALIICAVMLLTMFPVAVLTIGAADIEGDWTTYRSADEYETPEEGEEPIIYKPEAGYEYTSEGFTVVPADYKDTTPFMTVQTKEKQSIKDGIYVEFRIDDFSYDGEFYGNSEEYVFVPIDLTDLWEGRINDMRLDLRMDDPESRSFDLCFAGMFRSEEEAYAYAGAWLTERGVSSDPVTAAPTESPTEAPEAQDTEAPAEGTQDPTDGIQTADTETDAPAQKGCGSVIGMGTVAVLAAAAATVALKKKD